MTTRPRAAIVADNSILNWQLQRGTDALSCEIRRRDGRFDVQLTLAPSRVALVTGHFENPITAVEWHASLAATLMDAGWVVTQHTHHDAPVAA
jgi:hypothetical protein